MAVLKQGLSAKSGVAVLSVALLMAACNMGPGVKSGLVDSSGQPGNGTLQQQTAAKGTDLALESNMSLEVRAQHANDNLKYLFGADFEASTANLEFTQRIQAVEATIEEIKTEVPAETIESPAGIRKIKAIEEEKTEVNTTVEKPTKNKSFKVSIKLAVQGVDQVVTASGILDANQNDHRLFALTPDDQLKAISQSTGRNYQVMAFCAGENCEYLYARVFEQVLADKNAPAQTAPSTELTTSAPTAGLKIVRAQEVINSDVSTDSANTQALSDIKVSSTAFILVRAGEKAMTAISEVLKNCNSSVQSASSNLMIAIWILGAEAKEAMNVASKILPTSVYLAKNGQTCSAEPAAKITPDAAAINPPLTNSPSDEELNSTPADGAPSATAGEEPAVPAAPDVPSAPKPAPKAKPIEEPKLATPPAANSGAAPTATETVIPTTTAAPLAAPVESPVAPQLRPTVDGTVATEVPLAEAPTTTAVAPAKPVAPTLSPLTSNKVTVVGTNNKTQAVSTTPSKPKPKSLSESVVLLTNGVYVDTSDLSGKSLVLKVDGEFKKFPSKNLKYNFTDVSCNSAYSHLSATTSYIYFKAAWIGGKSKKSQFGEGWVEVSDIIYEGDEKNSNKLISHFSIKPRNGQKIDVRYDNAGNIERANISDRASADEFNTIMAFNKTLKPDLQWLAKTVCKK